MTEAQLRIDAQIARDILAKKKEIERAAFKRGVIDVKAWNRFCQEDSHQMNLIDRKLNEDIRVLRAPQMELAAQAATNENMRVDMERRRYERFMREAGPVLETAFGLEEDPDSDSKSK